MTSDWRSLAGSLKVEANVITFQLDRERAHAVYVVEHHDGWELSGEAADADTLQRCSLTHAELWRRNRYQDLVDTWSTRTVGPG